MGTTLMFESVRGLGDTKGREKRVFHEKLVLVTRCETFCSGHGRDIVFTTDLHFWGDEQQISADVTTFLDGQTLKENSPLVLLLSQN
jgi:hypothetical protein